MTERGQRAEKVNTRGIGRGRENEERGRTGVGGIKRGAREPTRREVAGKERGREGGGTGRAEKTNRGVRTEGGGQEGKREEERGGRRERKSGRKKDDKGRRGTQNDLRKTPWRLPFLCDQKKY
jgi:hypothetical protein